MALLLDESIVRSLLTMPAALEAVESAFQRLASGSAELHARQRFQLGDKSFLHHMAAVDRASGWAGLKIYTTVAGVYRFLVPLYRAATGELAALVEADFLGQMRTGAASGVATKYMARADAATVGIIGAGGQARTQLDAIAAVRPLTGIRTYSRHADRCAQFAREMTERLSVPVQPATSAEEAVCKADIVVTATTSSKPVLLGSWLAPGTHINAIGANFPQKRELDDEAVRCAEIIAADSREQSKLESGDLLQVLGDPSSGDWSVVRELSEIVSGRTPGRTNDRQITLFKSNGVAIEDVVVAGRVYEMAVERGLGREVPVFNSAG